MAKIKLSRKEIEKMILDQLGCKEVDWNKNGDATLELDMEDLKKKEEHIHHHYPTPITITKPCQPYRWVITNDTSDAISTAAPHLTEFTLNYSTAKSTSDPAGTT